CGLFAHDAGSSQRIAQVALGVFALTCAAGVLFELRENRAITEREGVLSDEHSTRYTALVPESSQTDGVAVLLHGARCSGSMMMSLARMLARNGVEVFVLDGPGHARSRVGASMSCGGDALER